jgi:hypothetical protein
LRQAQELTSGPIVAAKTRLLSFNRVKSRVITGFNILRRHLYIMGLIENPLCRKYEAEEETSAHVLCRPHLDITIWAIFSEPPGCYKYGPRSNLELY